MVFPTPSPATAALAGGRAFQQAAAAGRVPMSVKNVEEDRDGGPQSLKDQEAKFWAFFGDKISEWNPCFDDHGKCRFDWDAEIGAHDMSVHLEGEVSLKDPHRVRLSAVMKAVFSGKQGRGESEADDGAAATPMGGGPTDRWRRRACRPDAIAALGCGSGPEGGSP